MFAFLWALLVFFLSFIAHVLVWRTRRPANSAKALLILFIVGYSIAILVTSAFGVSENLASEHTLLIASLTYFSIVSAYINTYPAIEVDSVSFKIATAVQSSGKSGLKKSSLRKVVGDDIAVKPRIKDLISEKYAYFDDGLLKLTRKGQFLANFYTIVRRIYGLGLGGLMDN